jgi:phospholipid N-methyltransferase
MTDGLGARSRDALLFGANFVKHPRMLGSIIPSSRRLVRRLLAPVDWDAVSVVVEYGPGVGTITVEVLRRLGPRARMVAIDTNRAFVAHLRRTVTDPRLSVVHGSAAEAGAILFDLGRTRADVVISGIPFATMPRALREEILFRTRAILPARGSFLVYQFSRAVRVHLLGHFAEIHEEFEPLNIMPARLFFCRPERDPGAPAGHPSRAPSLTRAV